MCPLCFMNILFNFKRNVVYIALSLHLKKQKFSNFVLPLLLEFLFSFFFNLFWLLSLLQALDSFLKFHYDTKLLTSLVYYCDLIFSLFGFLCPNAPFEKTFIIRHKAAVLKFVLFSTRDLRLTIELSKTEKKILRNFLGQLCQAVIRKPMLQQI